MSVYKRLAIKQAWEFWEWHISIYSEFSTSNSDPGGSSKRWKLKWSVQFELCCLVDPRINKWDSKHFISPTTTLDITVTDIRRSRRDEYCRWIMKSRTRWSEDKVFCKFRKNRGHRCEQRNTHFTDHVTRSSRGQKDPQEIWRSHIRLHHMHQWIVSMGILYVQ